MIRLIIIDSLFEVMNELVEWVIFILLLIIL